MKKTNYKKPFAVLAIFAVIVFNSVTATIAQKDTAKDDGFGGRCSLRMLEGNYGYSFSGTFLVSPTTPVPLASVGRMTFDGRGNISGNDTNSFGGSVSSYPTTGTYTVEPNCTGTLNVNLPDGFVITNNISIVDNGDEIFLIQTNPGTIISGVLKRQ